LIGPNVAGHMLPWATRLVPGLATNLELHKVYKDAHTLMQISRTTCPNVAYNLETPQASKNVFRTCPIVTMNVIIFLLPLGEVLAANEGAVVVDSPLVGTIMAPALIREKMPFFSLGPFAVPNENISTVFACQYACKHYIAQIVYC